MRHYRYNARKRNIQKGIKVWFFQILAVVLLGVALVFFCVQFVFVHGHAMKPTYNNGDLVLVNKIGYRIHSPKRGDVILFKVNQDETERYVIGRLMGLPGETVQIRDGKFYADYNQIQLETDNLIKTPGKAQKAITLGKDEYFILCDNINSGEDSRMTSIGNVKKDQIIGKIVKTIISGKD